MFYDGKHFEAWLSLGPRGDTIPTKTGRIDREALLSTEIIGANYWTKVDNGRVMNALNTQIEMLTSQIQSGMALHIEMETIRSEAAAGVVAISDVLGGADFPSFDIWSGPNDVLISAMQMRNVGRVWGANVLLIIAAIGARNAADLLDTYIDKSTAGAARSVKVLKVARTAGKVAEAGLLVASGTALVGAASGAVVGDAAVDAAAEKELGEYLARNPDIAGKLSSVKFVPGPRGAVLRGVSSTRGVGEGFHKW